MILIGSATGGACLAIVSAEDSQSVCGMKNGANDSVAFKHHSEKWPTRSESHGHTHARTLIQSQSVGFDGVVIYTPYIH